MKKILAALALSALVAGPTFAKGPTEKQKEATDKTDVKKDDKGAKNDAAASQRFWALANKEQGVATAAWRAAGALWNQRQAELHKMHTANAAAHNYRLAAIRANVAAQKLFHAEGDRARALSDRLTADQLLKNAYGHSAAAAAAKLAIAEGQKAKADLQKNPAFADAIKTIDLDITRQTTSVQKEEAAAKADSDVAHALLAAATKMENDANALEKAANPAPAIVVKAPPPPAKIVVKAAVAKGK